jgi:4-coumarate--CoA ligase
VYKGLTVLIHQAFYSGYTLIVMPKFDLASFCDLTQEHKITMAYIVPPIILQLAKNPLVSKYNLSSLRMVNSGAAPLTKDLVEEFYARHKVPVKQGYGLSETSPTTHNQPWDRWRSTIGSVGTLLANQTAKYMNEKDQEVPAGEVGELWIKGPNVFLGYLNNEEGTKNALTDDGYFKTGDVGYQDEKGNFYITDRVKELIKYSGFQVPPAELEGLLLSHPKIVDVAVTGVHSKERQTELPRAYVVLKEGEKECKETAEEIAKWLEAKVASHKKLRGGVHFIKEIPKSVSGKILRRVLRDQAKEEEERPKAKL